MKTVVVCISANVFGNVLGNHNVNTYKDENAAQNAFDMQNNGHDTVMLMTESEYDSWIAYLQS